jgi:hypothetical protein
MANESKSDADYVEDAYEDAIGIIFKQLFNAIDTEPASEKQSVARFVTGLAAARRARALALKAIEDGPLLPAAEVTTGKRQRKPAAS